MTSDMSAEIPELLRRARRILEQPPAADGWNDRATALRRTARELDSYGVDGDSLIRFGMADLFVGPVLGSVMLSLLLDVRHEEQPDHLIDVVGWRASLGVAVTPNDESTVVQSFMASAPRRVEAWVACAPLDKLLRLAPVDADELARASFDLDEARALVDTYRWLVQRTIETKLSEWATSSLRLEYRYSVLGDEPEAPAAFLDIVRSDTNALAHALAERASREAVPSKDARWPALLSSVLKQARSLLVQQRCTEAAALFEFLVSQDPSDAVVRNNLGFCLVTTEPDQAEEHLRDAARMGFQLPGLNLYNQACCATTQTRQGEVLLAIEHHWVTDLDDQPTEAFVWRKTDLGWQGVDSADVRADLAVAALGLARELGRLDRVPIWRDRHCQVTGIAIG